LVLCLQSVVECIMIQLGTSSRRRAVPTHTTATVAGSSLSQTTGWLPWSKQPPPSPYPLPHTLMHSFSLGCWDFVIYMQSNTMCSRSGKLCQQPARTKSQLTATAGARCYDLQQANALLWPYSQVPSLLTFKSVASRVKP
jgi:hypothetical protein